MPRGRGLHPDTRLEVALNGAATRLALEEAELGEAVQKLRTLAAGRADLLAAAAGGILGSYLASPGTTNPRMVYAVALLIAAGADVDMVVEHVDRARAVTVAGNRPRPPATDSSFRSETKR